MVCACIALAMQSRCNTPIRNTPHSQHSGPSPRPLQHLWLPGYNRDRCIAVGPGACASPAACCSVGSSPCSQNRVTASQCTPSSDAPSPIPFKTHTSDLSTPHHSANKSTHASTRWDTTSTCAPAADAAGGVSSTGSIGTPAATAHAAAARDSRDSCAREAAFAPTSTTSSNTAQDVRLLARLPPPCSNEHTCFASTPSMDCQQQIGQYLQVGVSTKHLSAVQENDTLTSSGTSKRLASGCRHRFQACSRPCPPLTPPTLLLRKLPCCGAAPQAAAVATLAALASCTAACPVPCTTA